MRILFLCGCLKPGSDGVGDYVRRLAGELIRKRHSAAIIALNDWKIQECFDGVQSEGNMQIPVLRLPSTWLLKKRMEVACIWADNFTPDWVSLQYVPFSFQSKGLPFGLSSALVPLGKGRRWHIMFHELWLVSRSLVPVKRVLIGRLQKILIKHLIVKLAPRVIHTQNQLSQHHLITSGFDAKILPLFSNIGVVSRQQQFLDALSTRKNEIRIVSFGSIYPNSLIDQFAKEAVQYEKKNGVQITLIMVGRSGGEQERWAAVWEGAGLKAEILGELPADKVSEVLSTASIGISSTPFVMSEKSGAVAAMREHGLPVVCIADPYTPQGFHFQPPPGLLEFSRSNFEDCMSYKPAVQHKQNLSVIADQFVNELLTAK